VKETTPAPLIIGIGSHVVAIERHSGAELWRTRLRHASIVTVHVDGPHVYAGSSGELFCLDRASGALLWHNKLRGLGVGLVVFGGSGAAEAQSMYEAQAAVVAASSSTSISSSH
jgi:outer membrane protein assembly factor BamB